MRRPLLAVLLIVLAGCVAPPASPPGAPLIPVTSPTSSVARPLAIAIPAIGASSTLIGTGLNPDGSAEVPPVGQPGQASWATWSPMPGEVGPSVVYGHVDGGGQPGIFARLDELATGDEILIERADATTARFVVSRVDTFPKDRFPTASVYGAVSSPELRLVTCGGSFDRAAGHYRDNVVAFAVLA